MHQVVNYFIDWIATTARQAPGLLLPASGGSDSALNVWLCAQAYPDKVKVVYVGDALRQRAWFEKIAQVQCIPEPVTNFKFDIEALRWAMFRSISKEENRWLVGSRNRTEQLLGSWSVASEIATYLPLTGLWKSEVMELCKFVGVPDEIIASSRRAHPECGRTPEMAAIPFQLVDYFLKVKEEGLDKSWLSELAPADRHYLEREYQRNLFKRNLPLCGPRLPKRKHLNRVLGPR